jgi:uroporphyrinogen decarboxylase
VLVSHQEPDRVLVDFGKHIGSFHRMAYDGLKAHLGIPSGSNTKILDRMAQNVVLDEVVCDKLGIDFRWVVPHWVGVKDVEIDGEPGYIDMWRTPHKYTEIGNYYAIAGFPLGAETVTLDDIDAFDWPDPHNAAMFEGLDEQAKAWYEDTDYVVGADGIKVGVLQVASQLRGYDRLFMDFALHPDRAHTLLSKITDLIKDMYVEYMKVVGPYVEVVVITDDQGTQKSLMVSPAMFREFIKPRLKEIIDAIKGQADVKVLMHCDGAIVPIIEDLIEIGVDILNPIQPVVKGLENTQALKEQYGDRICFHGGIDVQQVMPNATVEEIRREVARRIHDLGPGGGYILAPCHNINVDIPVATVVAMFDAAQEYGRYPLERDNAKFR